MNLNGLIDFILKRVMGRVMNRGIDAGIKHVVSRGKPAAEDGTPAQLTPAERRQLREGRQAARRAKQAARLGRKMMR